MSIPTKPLRIALVSDALYPYNIGGKEKRIYELSTRLAARGHEVTIYTMKWWQGTDTRVTYEGVIHEAISPLFPLYSGERRSMREAILFSLHCFKLLGKRFDILDADHMPHLILFPLKLVTLIKRKPFFATWNEVWGRAYWMKYLGPLGAIAYIIERLSVLMPDKFIAISEDTAQKLRNEFHVRQHIEIIPNGINLKVMRAIKPSKLTSDVIYTGRLLQHKHVDRLINAVAAIAQKQPSFLCRIVGNGPEELNLKNLVRKLNLEKQVVFHDFLTDNKALFSLIKAAKLFVLPSSREGFGLVTIEAQALGVPVITYNHQHNASKSLIREGETGMLFDIKTKQLDAVIQTALHHPFSKQTLADAVKRYDWETITDSVEECYLR